MTANAGVEHSRADSHGRDASRWDASLALRVERIDNRSVLTQRMHRGPLIVQKALYPEGPDVCQCVIVHPPAGIVGGDQLLLSASIGAGAHAQLTTPGAARWYRSAGLPAQQMFRAHIGDGGWLEYLPQGTIVHDGAIASSTMHIALDGASGVVAAEVVALGRRAAGEQFRCGEWRQRIDIVRDGAPIWSERAVLAGGDALLTSPVGLGGSSVFGTLIAVGGHPPDTSIPELRALSPSEGQGSVTRLPVAIVARYVGDSMQAAHAYLAAVWGLLRPSLCQRIAVRPRIWST